jgi:hypothetical protein
VIVEIFIALDKACNSLKEQIEKSVFDGSLSTQILKTGRQFSDDPKLLFDQLNQD